MYNVGQSKSSDQNYRKLNMPRTCMHYIFCFLYYYHKKQLSDNKKNQNRRASVNELNFKNYSIFTGFSIDKTIAFMLLENKCYNPQFNIMHTVHTPHSAA